jgi:hypothetical protein
MYTRPGTGCCWRRKSVPDPMLSAAPATCRNTATPLKRHANQGSAEIEGVRDSRYRSTLLSESHLLALPWFRERDGRGKDNLYCLLHASLHAMQASCTPRNLYREYGPKRSQGVGSFRGLADLPWLSFDCRTVSRLLSHDVQVSNPVLLPLCGKMEELYVPPMGRKSLDGHGDRPRSGRTRCTPE